MPVAVIAEIGARARVIGAIGLHAVPDAVVAAGLRGNRDGAVVILVIVIARPRRVIARPAIVAARRERAADYGTGDEAGNDGTAAAAIGVTAAVATATKTRATAAKSTRAGTGVDATTAGTMHGGNAGYAAFTGTRLRETCGRRGHQSQNSNGAQNFKTNHFPAPSRGPIQPAVRANVPDYFARTEMVCPQLYAV
jgi:hypothetical protein